MNVYPGSHPTAPAELYGLLGYPLVHSFSARYFADKFARESIKAVYRNFEYDDIERAMREIGQMPGLRGFNVTIPYKQAVMRYLQGLSDEAREIGAVNVVKVVRQADGSPGLYGFNSDVLGFRASIAPLLRRGVHRSALVLGTGGASKAVVCGLRGLGVCPRLVSRHPREGVLSYADLTAPVLDECKVIVNCTPVGMYPHANECPDIPYGLLTPDHLLYDLVYNPEVTQFMSLGIRQGAAVKNGLEMLHLQAEEAWRIWQDDEVLHGNTAAQPE